MAKKRLFLLLSAALFAIFIYFSYLVAKEQFTQFDFDTTVRFQDHISRRFDFPFSIFSIIGSVEISGPIWLAMLTWLFLKRMWKVGLSLLLLPVALAIEIFGKAFVLHPGPPHLFYRGVIHFDLPSSYVPVDYSYPSGHVTRTAFIVMFLIGFFYFRKIPNYFLISVFLLLFLTIMMISRIYLAEHWASDVVGGLLIGSSFGLLAAVTVPSKTVRPG